MNLVNNSKGNFPAGLIEKISLVTYVCTHTACKIICLKLERAGDTRQIKTHKWLGICVLTPSNISILHLIPKHVHIMHFEYT